MLKTWRASGSWSDGTIVLGRAHGVRGARQGQKNEKQFRWGEGAERRRRRRQADRFQEGDGSTEFAC